MSHAYLDVSWRQFRSVSCALEANAPEIKLFCKLDLDPGLINSWCKPFAFLGFVSFE
jgi:hypothetical protein